MALLYGLLWRLLLCLVHMNRAFVAWLQARTRCLKRRLWERALASFLLPAAFTELSVVERRKMHGNREPKAVSAGSPSERQALFLQDGKSVEKLPVHIGLVLVNEEPSYTDVANLVVWCMALGISHVSVYDHNGDLQKNNSRLMQEIAQLQKRLLGVEGSKVEFLSNGSEKHVVSCRPVVSVLSPEDGKHSIVQAAQQLCRSVENKERSPKDISVAMLDSLLREFKNIPDPDLVLKLGPVDSTLGFLPWHIRLTEFIGNSVCSQSSGFTTLKSPRGGVPVMSQSPPPGGDQGRLRTQTDCVSQMDREHLRMSWNKSLSTHRNVSYEDLLGALHRFGSCQQRLGK